VLIFGLCFIMALLDGSVSMSAVTSANFSSLPFPIDSLAALRAVPRKSSPTGAARFAPGGATGGPQGRYQGARDRRVIRIDFIGAQDRIDRGRSSGRRSWTRRPRTGGRRAAPIGDQRNLLDHGTRRRQARAPLSGRWDRHESPRVSCLARQRKHEVAQPTSRCGTPG
jgi:hypothetical protein